MKSKWLNTVCLAAAAVLLSRCGFTLSPERQQAESSQVPSKEIRQQYEVDLNENDGTVKVRAYFLRSTGEIEHQVLLREGSTIHVNGKLMTEVVRAPERKSNQDVAYYELSLPLPLKAIEFDWLSPDGKRYQNRVTVPPMKVKTTFAEPLQRGQPYTLELEPIPGATYSKDLAAAFSELFVPNVSLVSDEVSDELKKIEDVQERLETYRARLVPAKPREGSMGTWDFDGENTARLKAGKAWLNYRYRIELPLQQASPAAGGFIRVDYQAKSVPVTVVEKEAEDDE